MITSIKIERLRGIREGELTDLTPLVILTGPNGCGKSTVLDAMLIGAHPVPGEGIGIAAARRGGTELPGQWLLWRGGAAPPALVTVGLGGGAVRVLSLDSVSPPGGGTQQIRASVSQDRAGITTKATVSATRVVAHDDSRIGNGWPAEVALVDPHFAGSPSLHSLLSRLKVAGRRAEADAALRVLLPDLVMADILTEDEKPVAYADFGQYAVPIAVAGEGVADLVRTSWELALITNGLALLEEPEAHLHPAAIWQAAKVVWAAVRRGVQVVISTHSLELIDALLAEAGDELEQLAVYSLVLEDGLLKHARFTGEEAAFSRGQIEQDLR